MKVLVTGFEAFGNDVINPTEKILKVLPKSIGTIQIKTLLLPVVRNHSIEMIEQVLKHETFDVVLSLGQAAGRNGISIERVAINVDDFRIPDNAGNKPIDEPIKEDGDAAYFSDLPIKAMVDALRKQQIMVSLSNSAGTYVCNHVMYGVAYLKEKLHLSYRSGFVHVPCLKEQVSDDKTPYMTLDEMVEAILVLLQTIETYEQDMKMSEGTIC